jgi:hypothetical protein
MQAIEQQWSFSEYDEADEAIAFAKVPFQSSLADLYNKVRLNAEKGEGDRS